MNQGPQELAAAGRTPGASPAGMAQVLKRNIEALIEHRQSQEKKLGWQDVLADRITRFTGSMLFVYLHLLLYGGWILINLGWIPGVAKFDPTFVVLAMIASVEAIFLSTFILISQNRMMAQADRRADLNLQISLLAEHEVTRLIQMNTKLCERLGIDLTHHHDIRELVQDVRPEEVLDTIAEREQRLEGESDRER
jgi:uncharacterized membrane protein